MIPFPKPLTEWRFINRMTHSQGRVETHTRRGGQLCCSSVSHLLQYLCAKNYQRTMRFDKVIPKIKECIFLHHSVVRKKLVLQPRFVQNAFSYNTATNTKNSNTKVVEKRSARLSSRQATSNMELERVLYLYNITDHQTLSDVWVTYFIQMAISRKRHKTET